MTETQHSCIKRRYSSFQPTLNDYIDTKYTNAQIPPGNKSTSPSLGSILIAVVHYVRIVELGLLEMQMTQNQGNTI